MTHQARQHETEVPLQYEDFKSPETVERLASFSFETEEPVATLRYRYSPGRKATWNDPPEPADLEVVSVTIKDRDVWEHLNETARERLTQIVLEEGDAAVAEEAGAKADYLYDQRKDRALEREGL